MANLKDIWDFQKYIGEYHKLTMAVNSIITFLYLVRYPSLYFNFRSPSNASSLLLNLGFFIMPCYYLLESYTTVSMCNAFLLYTCKYIIHHLLTISLMLTVFQYSFFNVFTLMTPAVHGFMNLGFYYNKTLEYLFCRWYAGSTLAGIVYFAWVAWKIPKWRNGALQVLLIGGFLAVNNFYTPELVQMCVINDQVDLPLNEGILHLAAFAGSGFICWKISQSEDKRKKWEKDEKGLEDSDFIV